VYLANAEGLLAQATGRGTVKSFDKEGRGRRTVEKTRRVSWEKSGTTNTTGCVGTDGTNKGLGERGKGQAKRGAGISPGEPE